MSAVELLAGWTAARPIRQRPLDAGWWCADPWGLMGRHWKRRFGAEALVIDLDHSAAELRLGIPGPATELVRLLSGEAPVGAGARIVALHSQLVKAHGTVLYCTERPARLRPAVRSWLVHAGRSGGARILAVVRNASELPKDWAGGELGALAELPSPVVELSDLAQMLPRRLVESIPPFSLATFLASCGGRLDLAELELLDLDTPEQVREALLTGQAARLVPESSADQVLRQIIAAVPQEHHGLMERLAAEPGAVRAGAEDFHGAQALVAASLARASAVNGAPALRASNELVRAALAAHVRAAARRAPDAVTPWLGRLAQANDAMDAEAGVMAARRLEAALGAHHESDPASGDWESPAGDAMLRGDEAELAAALLVEHRYLRGGAVEALRAYRALPEPCPSARAVVVRASLETGLLHHTVASWCVTELGERPRHRDDDVVLRLLPEDSLRERYREGLVASEEGSMRHSVVAFARVVRAAHDPHASLRPRRGERGPEPGAAATPDRGETLAGLRREFNARLYRLTAGQALLIALALGGYRRELGEATRAILAEIRPWHGALAGVHQLAGVLSDLQVGFVAGFDAALASVTDHARAWKHETIVRIASLLGSGAWLGADAAGEDVQGAQVRGRYSAEKLIIEALYGQLDSIALLASLRGSARDPRLDAAALWAAAALRQEPLVESATVLADRGQATFVTWLANAAVLLDPGRLHPDTRALLAQAGRGTAQSSETMDAVRSLVRDAALTEREAEVERHRLAQHDVGETARIMGVSERTVESHRAAARAKARSLEELGFLEEDARRWCLELSDAPAHAPVHEDAAQQLRPTGTGLRGAT